jgi:hypothetical protein
MAATCRPRRQLIEFITKLRCRVFRREIMLFMLVSHARPGTKREHLVERLTRQLHFETWDLVRQGALSHILYKVGEEPGFFALLNASNFAEAKSLVEAAASRLDEFDLEIQPVKHFPQFD